MHLSPADSFVRELYHTFEGRVPFCAGIDSSFSKVYPIVYEDKRRVPIGLIAAAPVKDNPLVVQLYHVSSFVVGKGHGKQILNYVCQLADKHKASIYLQAEVQFTSQKTPAGEELINWYRQFGFVGTGFMRREPNV